MTLPYATADAKTARDQITKILRQFGCEAIGFMDDFAGHTVVLAFKHRGRNIELRASAEGWANLYLKQHPRSRDKALEQGMKAVNSILRDWVKGQITAVECGILSFESVFLPYMLTDDGRPVIEHLKDRGLLIAKTPERRSSP